MQASGKRPRISGQVEMRSKSAAAYAWEYAKLHLCSNYQENPYRRRLAWLHRR